MRRAVLPLTVAVLLITCLAFLPNKALGDIRIPPGYRITTVASGIPYASNLSFDDSGRMWVTSAAADLDSTGWVWLVPKPGAAPQQIIGPLHSALGLTWLHDKLYVSSVGPTSGDSFIGRVTAYWGLTGSSFQHSKVVVDGIPVGEHRVDSLAVGPDDRLYLGVGSQTDRDPPTERLSASVISFRPDGSDVRVAASGLRNPYGLAFVPDSSRLLVTDEGIDFRGNRPPEELNSFDVSRPPPDFGFPQCWDQGGSACSGTVEAALRLDPHSAATGVAVSAGFGSLGPSAFVAEYGSSPGFGTQPTGAQIVRVPVAGDRIEPGTHAQTFATGFHHPDPLGLAVGPDGALYATLWDSGEVIRIAPTAPAPSAPASLTSIGTLSGLVVAEAAIGLPPGLSLLALKTAALLAAGAER